MKFKSFFLSLLALCTIAAVSSCQEDSDNPANDKAPVITLNPASLSAEALGGNYTIQYAIENPVENATLQAESAQEWISDITVSANEISFVVAKNSAEEGRNGSIDLTYPNLKDAVKIQIQQAGYSNPTTDTAIEIQVYDVNEISFSYDLYPQDKTMPFIFFCETVETLEAAGAYTDEEILAYDMSFYVAEAAMYDMSLEDYLWAYYISKGDQIGMSKIGIQPGKEFIIYAYGVDFNDAGELLITTDVIKYIDKTNEVEMVESPIAINVEESGYFTNVTFRPENHSGIYFYIVEERELLFEGMDYATMTDEEISESLTSLWYQYLKLYLQFGFSFDMIAQELTLTGEETLEFSLYGERSHIAAAIPLTDEGIACAYPSFLCFETKPVDPSGNQLTITVSDIKATSAVANITTTNDDPYVFACFSAEFIQGMNDREIIDFYLENYINYTTPLNGDFSYKFTNLEPNTKYWILAFGYAGGQANTGLFRESFFTLEAADADIEVTLNEIGLFDVQEIIAIDPAYSDYSDYEAFWKIEWLTTPQADGMYYGLYKAASVAGLSDENLTDAIISKGERSNFTVTHIVSYDVEYVLLGMAYDQNGNRSKLYRTEPFTLKYEDRDNPYGFFGQYNASPIKMYEVPMDSNESKKYVFLPE